ncbi:MAG TPA: HNH endonuclease signature motif containing protein [Acidimicrobiales bacterium]|jgi:5-methylcytosine-specific restriction endonuclease McrA
MPSNPAYRSRQYQHNRLLVLAAAAGRCYMPGCQRLATTADHIVPLCEGGGHAVENLRACCAHHNSVGAARLMNERRSLGRRSRRW